ncbi:MAG: hypothetical protein ACOY3Z_01905 [Thermodesulfobacteriota bacterium]
MSTFTHLMDKRHGLFFSMREFSLTDACARITWKRVGEVAWGGSAFLLFLLLGPFSAVAALLGVASLAKQVQHGEPELLG